MAPDPPAKAKLVVKLSVRCGTCRTLVPIDQARRLSERKWRCENTRACDRRKLEADAERRRREKKRGGPGA
jgi:hypothetical protein